MGRKGSGSAGLEMPLAKTLYIICAAASWLGLRRCHSSIRSRSHWPVISRGTYAPLGRITFPSVLRLHFPSLMYSNTSMQLRMKCSGDPQFCSCHHRQERDEVVGHLWSRDYSAEC